MRKPILISEKTHERLRAHCKEKGLVLQVLAESLVLNYLASLKKG